MAGLVRTHPCSPTRKPGERLICHGYPSISGGQTSGSTASRAEVRMVRIKVSLLRIVCRRMAGNVVKAVAVSR